MIPSIDSNVITTTPIENWLTRKPNPNAVLVVLASVLTVTLGSYTEWNDLFGLTKYLSANHQLIFNDLQIWRAWTSLVVHGDFKHLGSNLFLFAILGYFLAGYFNLILFPLTAFIMGGFINLIVLQKMPPLTSLIGLSGVVYWMGGTWLMLYYFIENRKTNWQKLLRALGVALLLFMPSEAFDPSISYESHFVGFVLGVLTGTIFYSLNRRFFRSADVSITSILNED